MTQAVFVDTCILLDATNAARAGHKAAIAALEHNRELVMSAQIVREYLAVATRATDVNGLGLVLEDALSNVEVFRRFVRLVPEEKPILRAFLALLNDVRCVGKTIHDAFVVATMQTHGIRTILTNNTEHFRRFTQIKIVQPSAR
jgi:predicted nucleic acid-binding protein